MMAALKAFFVFVSQDAPHPFAQRRRQGMGRPRWRAHSWVAASAAAWNKLARKVPEAAPSALCGTVAFRKALSRQLAASAYLPGHEQAQGFPMIRCLAGRSIASSSALTECTLRVSAYHAKKKLAQPQGEPDF